MNEPQDPTPSSHEPPLPLAVSTELSSNTPPPLPKDATTDELRKHWWLPPKPARGPDPWAHRRGEPRVFALGWTIYILAATTLCFAPLAFSLGMDPLASRFAGRMLLITLAAGIAILWPVVRLSQARPACGGLLASWQDIVVIFIPLQAALWPLALVTEWSLGTLAAVDALLFAWAWTIGGVLGLALGPRHGRSLSADAVPGDTRGPYAGVLVLILLVVLGVPIAAAFRPISLITPVRPDTVLLASPLSGVLELTADRSWSGQITSVYPEHWFAILGTFLAGATLWMLGAAIHAAFPPPAFPPAASQPPVGDTPPGAAYPSPATGRPGADH